MVIKEHDEQQPKLMIIPMIDIIFFLLVFFMLSMLGMVQQRSMAVDLPKSETSQVAKAETIPITITADGKLYYEKELVDLNTLIGVLQKEKQSHDVSVVLLGDASVPYGQVVEVMDGIKKSGVEKVSIATNLKE